MILASLKEFAQTRALNQIVTDVRIGLCYTAVLLDSGSAGVAYTFRHDIPFGCACFDEGGALAGKRAEEIVQFIDSPDLLKRTVGIATANALINIDRNEFTAGDILDTLMPDKNDIVGMIGYFGPLVPKLKKIVGELRIFEKTIGKIPDVYPEEEAFEFLPRCTTAIITSTSLINLTLEKLIEASKGCQKVALVGASTPLAGEVFSSLGVHLLSGVIVQNPGAILRTASECGGMRNFKGYIKKVNFIFNT
jgi:uncharacterized protein